MVESVMGKFSYENGYKYDGNGATVTESYNVIKYISNNVSGTTYTWTNTITLI